MEEKEIPTDEQMEVRPARKTRRQNMGLTTPPRERVEEGAKKETKARVKCIYFQEPAHLDRLEELSVLYPRSSVSTLVQQLVAGFVKATEQIDPEERCIEVKVKVYL